MHFKEKLWQLLHLVWKSHIRRLSGTPRLPESIGDDECGAMFLGHSSFLVQFGSQSVLIDPVFAKRLVVLRRQRRAGILIKNLPAIDAVLITHAHMDHLNLPSLRRIAKNMRRRFERAPVIIVPSGVEGLVDRLGFSEVHVLGWWDSVKIGSLTATLTPAKHWGARFFRDTDRLYGGYVIAEGQDRPNRLSVYHSGDTAYFSGFKEIGGRLQPRIALMPIGAYFPDSYRTVHTNPEEALQGFIDIGAEIMVPMHFGTFLLGQEPVEEPVQRLLCAAKERQVEKDVRVLTEGQTLIVKRTNKLTAADFSSFDAGTLVGPS